MEIGKKYLPIGTTVILKGGKKEVMIVSYCIFPQGEILENGMKVDGKGKVFDYGACTYPEGLISSEQILCFNHDNIDRIVHMGYESDAQKELSENIIKLLDVEEELSKHPEYYKTEETQPEVLTEKEGQA